MTARPYIYNGSADIDLGAGSIETISGTRSLISLSDVLGYTKDSQLAALLAGERVITVSGSKKFADRATMDAWTQSVDALWQGTKLTSVRYYAQQVQTPYSGGNTYFTVLVTHFECTKEEGEEEFVANFTIEMKEGKGVNDP